MHNALPGAIQTAWFISFSRWKSFAFDIWDIKTKKQIDADDGVFYKSWVFYTGHIEFPVSVVIFQIPPIRYITWETDFHAIQRNEVLRTTSGQTERIIHIGTINEIIYFIVIINVLIFDWIVYVVILYKCFWQYIF